MVFFFKRCNMCTIWHYLLTNLWFYAEEKLFFYLIGLCNLEKDLWISCPGNDSWGYLQEWSNDGIINNDLKTIIMMIIVYRVRQRESEEEEKNRIELQQRMQALLSLKNNIEGNRVCDTLQLFDSVMFHEFLISFINS